MVFLNFKHDRMAYRLLYCSKQMIKKMSPHTTTFGTTVIFTQVGALSGLRMNKLMFNNYLRNINKNSKYLKKLINRQSALNKPEGGFSSFQ